jgi:hypothetical protein
MPSSAEAAERREEDARAGYRNGHQPPVAVKTTMGPVEPAMSVEAQGHRRRFCSHLFGSGVTHTSALEALVISAWCGLSLREVESALAEMLGPRGSAQSLDGEPHLLGAEGAVRPIL